MTAHSSALMALLDALVLGAFAYAVWVYRKHRDAVLLKELRDCFFLIFLGIGLVSLFYLCDLVCNRAVPLLFPAFEPGVFTRLHHEYIPLVLPAGLALIVTGFAKELLKASAVIADLRTSEGHVRQMDLEAVDALSKLDRSEAELEAQNDRFRAAIENMSQGLCMYDKDQRLIICNSRYAEMYGLSADLCRPGTAFQNILEYRIRNNIFAGEAPEDYIQERLTSVAMVTATSKIQRLSDGRVLAITHRPMPDGGWVGTHEDISELAKAEAMNQRLARIVENAINEVYVFDAESLGFLQVNTSACDNLGYTMGELRGLTPLDLMPEFTAESFEELVAPLRSETKAHIQFETGHRRKNGTTYDVRVTLQQIRSQNQQVFAATAEDITERKRVERELKQSQELFMKAFQANPIPFSISNPDGTIYDLNEAYLTTMGYTREEAIGNSALKLNIWANPRERAHFVELLKEQGVVEAFETQYRTKSGELRDMVVSGEWVEVRGEPRMFNISHDVTERKATERRLLEDRDALQDLVNEATADLKAKARELEAALAREKELNELQRQFVSMASHEFRTPLAIIDSTAQRLRKNADGMSSDDALRRIEKIRGAVERMTRLMESTLTAARLEEGKIAVDIQSCDVRELVTEVCARHQEFARDHVISCEAEGLPSSIKADANALDQVLTNLLSNAVKYSPDSPQVEVKAYGENGGVVIQVRDYGLGIDEDDLPKMFGRFFRAGTSTGIVGTGIGLNLVKTLVELHGGTITVDSKRDAGSTFTVRLPAGGPAQAEKAA